MPDKELAVYKTKLVDIVDKAMRYAYEQARAGKSLPVKEAATAFYVGEIVKLIPEE